MSDKQKSIVVSLSADTARLQADMARAASTVSANTDKISKSFASVNSVASTMGKAFGAVSALLVVGPLVALADSYTRIEGRLKLVTNSSLELADVQARLQAIAQSSRSEYIATAEVFTRFAQATKGQGVAQEELLSITESLNKAFVISGASTAEAQAAMIQLSQGFASGVLRGDEFNSVMEQGGRVIDMLTSYTGKNRGELRAMAEQGMITSDVLRGAFLQGAESVNKEFERMPTTVGQAGVVLGNVLGALVNDANAATGATAGIANSIVQVAKTIEENRGRILGFFKAMAEVSSNGLPVGGDMGVDVGPGALGGRADSRLGGSRTPAIKKKISSLETERDEISSSIALRASRGADANKEIAELAKVNAQLKEQQDILKGLTSSPYVTGEAGGKINVVAAAYKGVAFQMQGVKAESLSSMKITDEMSKKTLAYIETKEQALKRERDAAMSGAKGAEQRALVEKKYQLELADLSKKKSRTTEDRAAEAAARKGEQFYQQTLDKLLPLEKAQRDYNEQLAALEIMDPTKGTERYQEALGNLESELKKVQDAHSGVAAARAAAESDISARTTRLASSVASGAITETAALPFEIDLLRQRLKLQQDHLDTLQKSTPQEISAYNSQVEAIERVNLELAEKERLLRLKDGWEGAKQALSDYGEMAADMGASVSDAVTGAFQGMEDAMVEFVTKGKLDFASLADAILADMARIAVRQSITGPLSSAIGGAIGSFFGAGGGATGSTISSNFTSAAVYGSAKGNVFNSPGLSAYSNSIVSKPTLFPFASGIGLMGEAGPEGILPLKRINGVLGVNAEGSGGGGAVIHQNITIDARGADSGVEQRIRQAAEEGARKGYQMVQTDIARRGPIYKGMR